LGLEGELGDDVIVPSSLLLLLLLSSTREAISTSFNSSSQVSDSEVVGESSNLRCVGSVDPIATDVFAHMLVFGSNETKIQGTEEEEEILVSTVILLLPQKG
jgi:hypothetical protein